LEAFRIYCDETNDEFTTKFTKVTKKKQ